MNTISIEVSDDIGKACGIEAIQEKIRRVLKWEQMALSAKKIQKAAEDAGLDNDALWEEARSKAWAEDKEKTSRISFHEILRD